MRTANPPASPVVKNRLREFFAGAVPLRKTGDQQQCFSGNGASTKRGTHRSNLCKLEEKCRQYLTTKLGRARSEDFHAVRLNLSSNQSLIAPFLQYESADQTMNAFISTES